MKCRYCGHEIPDGMLYCEECGKEVCIVPDYNPLDDVLAAQVRGSLGETADLDIDIYEDEDAVGNTGGTAAGARRTAAMRDTAGGRRTGNTGRNTGRNTAEGRRTGNTGRTTGRNTAKGVSGNTGRGRTTGDVRPDREQRRRKAERMKALKKKRRRLILIILAIIIVLCGGVGILLYNTSYTGIINKGNKAFQVQNYDEALTYYKKAAAKKPAKPEAYTKLSKVYIKKNDLSAAENVFLDAIEAQNTNASLYQACADFYLETDQAMEIPLLLEDAADSVQSELDDYAVAVPDFSLDGDETYDDVQQVTLTADKGDTVHYTADGTDPDLSSAEFSEPIQIGEGETVISAIAVNKKGVPSLAEKRTYTVEFPIVSAPAVSPSTGQYEQAVQIEVKVPDGYEAYYTTDKSDPTTASEKYSGPIDMPQGETIFKAILVDKKGRTSGITTRNYVLETK